MSLTSEMEEKGDLLFLLAGQSNMAGRGRRKAERAPRPPPDLNVRAFHTSSHEWSLANHPLHDDKPDKAAIGPGLDFALELRRRFKLAGRPQQQVLLVPCAVGGSPIHRWSPGADLYERALDSTRRALDSHAARTGPCTIAGILWHQGESDSGSAEAAASHAEATCSALDALRRQLGAPDAAVVVGELGYFLDQAGDERFAHAATVNAGLVNLPRALPHCTTVSAHGLEHGGDRLHFSAAAAEAFGVRYAEAWVRLAGEQFGLHVAEGEATAALHPFTFPRGESVPGCAASAAILD